MVGYALPFLYPQKTKSLLSRAVDWAGGDPEMFDKGEYAESIQPIKDNINEFMDTPVELSYKDNTFSAAPRDMFTVGPGPAFQPANLSKLYNTATKNISKSFDKYGPLAFSPLNVPGALDRVNDAASFFNEQWQNAKDKKNSTYIPGKSIRRAAKKLHPKHKVHPDIIRHLSAFPLWNPNYQAELAANQAQSATGPYNMLPEVDNRPSVGPGNYTTATDHQIGPGGDMPFEADTTMAEPMEKWWDSGTPRMDTDAKDLLNPFWNPGGPLYMDFDDYFDSESGNFKDVSEWPRIMNQAVYDTNEVNKRFTSPTKRY